MFRMNIFEGKRKREKDKEIGCEKDLWNIS